MGSEKPPQNPNRAHRIKKKDTHSQVLKLPSKLTKRRAIFPDVHCSTSRDHSSTSAAAAPSPTPLNKNIHYEYKAMGKPEKPLFGNILRGSSK